jgi:hypothetical protein
MTETLTEVPWEEKNTKYIFPGGHLVVEEIISPWDLLVESRYIGTILGTSVHQVAIQHGLERVFSIRQARNRLPLADILTRPVGARVLLPYWKHWRVLNTSNTFNIDGQELLVIEVLSQNKRAPEPLINLARAFFVGRGGVLGEECPTGYVLTAPREIEKWGQMCIGKWESDLLCGNMPKNLTTVPIKFSRTTQVLDMDEALALMKIKYFKTIYLDVREAWVEGILDHLWVYPEDKPQMIFLFPASDRCEVLLKQAKQIMTEA